MKLVFLDVRENLDKIPQLGPLRKLDPLMLDTFDRVAFRTTVTGNDEPFYRDQQRSKMGFAFENAVGYSDPREIHAWLTAPAVGWASGLLGRAGQQSLPVDEIWNDRHPSRAMAVE